ncbi:histidine kinase [Paenibacillus selenitireducens]|uniref:histidine kinase n=1 Tax=Paenibacillus selenitireducens TaxID=1324314 RepID=A0A1T2XFI1_9BACL|nr:HAMP domain-containing sensor histidine kinase [Paenibacillus selenitireducens]OPA78610.1 histidine kinase [Paenibacillus selenitireducens]
MTIRLRLTFIYSGILASALLLFGIALYSFLQYYLYNDLKSSLQEQTHLFRDKVKYSLAVDPVGWNFLIQIEDFDTVQTGMYVQIINLITGQKERSNNLGNAQLPYAPKDSEEKQGYYTTATIRHTPFLIYNAPLLLNDKVVGVLQAAYPIGVVTKFLTILQYLLFFLSSIVILLAVCIGWLSAKRSLRPIYALIQATQQIQSSEDLGKRVQIEHTADEVSLLSKTINGMLDRIQTMYAELDRAYATQRRFIADASHELRTPLTTINGNAELLHKIWTPYNQPPYCLADKHEIEISVEALHDIVDEGHRMRRLVHDLLTLARADAGQQMKQDRVEIRPVIEAVVRKAQLLPKTADFQANGLEVLENLYVIGDKDYLQQLFFIFLDNAFKFTSEGTVEFVASKGEHDIQFMIRDSGIGMSPEEISHVFERFYRADTSRGNTPGTGLGLSIAKWILDEHRGTVEIKSCEHEGTTFIIRLPMAD